MPRILKQDQHSHLGKYKKSMSLLLASIMSFFVVAMYSSIILSKLAVHEKVPQPKSLQELAVKFPNTYIYINNRGPIPEYIKSSSYYDDLKERFQF